MKRFDVKTLAAAAAVTAVAALAMPGAAHAAEKIKMSMASVGSSYSIYYVALEKGYYKEEGLDIDIIKAGGGVATPALISGSLDVSTSASSAVSAILKGAEMRAIFLPFDRPTYQIWSTNKSLKTLADLKGKPVGIITRGDTFEIGVRLVLTKNGLDPNSVSLTPLGPGNGRFAAISSGSLPAAVVAKREVEILRAQGALEKGNMLANMYDEIRMPYGGLAVSEKMIKERAATVKGVVRATLKGMMYMRAFREKTIDYTMKYSGDTARDALADEYAEVVASMTEDGTVPDDVLKDELAVRAELIKMAKDKIPAVDKIYDLSFVRQVARELKESGWKPTP